LAVSPEPELEAQAFLKIARRDPQGSGGRRSARIKSRAAGRGELGAITSGFLFYLPSKIGFGSLPQEGPWFATGLFHE